jgi:phage/plasmid-like protein (TIGR03299 family)
MMTMDQSFSARQVPWAKIGTVIDEPDVDSLRAAELGGIDFNVDVRDAAYFSPYTPLTGPDDEPLLDGEEPLYEDAFGEPTTSTGQWRKVTTRRAIVRADTEEWYSYVSTDYKPVQFREAFAFMDTINPRYVAAGALSDGRQGFMVVELPDHERADVDVDGEVDPHKLYVVLKTSHDLSSGIKIAVTTLRERCMNMLTLPSFVPNAPQSWSIRHVGDPRAKLEQAHTTLAYAGRYREVFERTVVQLASVHVSSDDLRQIARMVLPNRLKTIDNQVEAIVDKYERADTVGYHGTGWGAVNAVSDYLQWGRTTAARTPQSEFTSPLEGDTAKYVNRTVQLVMARA